MIDELFVIREAVPADLCELLKLYCYLHDNIFPAVDERIELIWSRIMQDDKHHILLGYAGETLAASCVLIVIENLTQAQRPYALIENVITHPQYRKRGYASQLLAAAKDIATERHCYKIMLLTGSKQESTLAFYRRAGYNSNDKTAFIQWL